MGSLGSVMILTLMPVKVAPPFAVRLSAFITSCHPSSSWRPSRRGDRTTMEMRMMMMMRHKFLQPFGMFSCVWPFQLHTVSWMGWGLGDEEQAWAGDTCSTSWVKEDTWWDKTERVKKKERSKGRCKRKLAPQRRAVRGQEQEYQLSVTPTPFVHHVAPLPPTLRKPGLFISCGWMRESGGPSLETVHNWKATCVRLCVCVQRHYQMQNMGFCGKVMNNHSLDDQVSVGDLRFDWWVNSAAQSSSKNSKFKNVTAEFMDYKHLYCK